MLARGVVRSDGASDPDHGGIGWVAVQILFLDGEMSLTLSSTEIVIHYEQTPPGVCPGKDRADAQLEAFLADTLRTEPASYSTMLACYAGNVDCSRCKAYLKANKERRKRMGHVKAVTQR